MPDPLHNGKYLKDEKLLSHKENLLVGSVSKGLKKRKEEAQENKQLLNKLKWTALLTSFATTFVSPEHYTALVRP